jgi:hypothetical protein
LLDLKKEKELRLEQTNLKLRKKDGEHNNSSIDSQPSIKEKKEEETKSKPLADEESELEGSD